MHRREQEIRIDGNIQFMPKHSSVAPYKVCVCHSTAGNEKTGVRNVCVDEEPKERKAMECTSGADGTDVSGTVKQQASRVHHMVRRSWHTVCLHSLIQTQLLHNHFIQKGMDTHMCTSFIAHAMAHQMI